MRVVDMKIDRIIGVVFLLPATKVLADTNGHPADHPWLLVAAAAYWVLIAVLAFGKWRTWFKNYSGDTAHVSHLLRAVAWTIIVTAPLLLFYAAHLMRPILEH